MTNGRCVREGPQKDAGCMSSPGLIKANIGQIREQPESTDTQVEGRQLFTRHDSFGNRELREGSMYPRRQR